MAKLANRIQNGLDEARILVLGIQILVGFQFRSFFEPGFEDLPGWARSAELASLCVMVVAFALVVAPTPFHRIAERGEDGERLHRYVTFCCGAALLPFAAGLGLELTLAAERVVGARAATAIGAGAFLAALACWYALPAARRTAHPQETDMSGTPLDKKIRHVLTEARTVLPGAQALLGFQLAVTLAEKFPSLPDGAQRLHLPDILLTALAIVLLMAPAAYHRLAEAGEETERFHRVASRFVVAAMVPLALAISGDLALVAWVLSERVARAAALGGAACAVFAVAWFGVALAARASRRRAGRTPAHATR